VGDLSGVALPQKIGSPKAKVAVSTRDKHQYLLLVLQSFQGDLALPQTIAIVVSAVAGRTQTDEAWVWVANIMVGVCCMKVHGIAFSCPFGFPLPTLLDAATCTPPSCLFLTLSG
jgi:hypothetical protein